MPSATESTPNRPVPPNRSSTPMLRSFQKLGAECIGTFVLVFAGCGAIMVDAQSGGTLGTTGISLVFGLAIMVMIYANGHISGAHFNPAVTLAFAVLGRFPWQQVLPYIITQCLGALLAALTLYALLGPIAALGATAPAGVWWQALLLEVVLTAILMFVITSVATDARAVGEMAGLAIGATVALAAMMGGSISGASMNPARSLGPALVSGQVHVLWLYMLGPVAGALLGAGCYQLIRCDEEPSKDIDGCC